MSEDTSSVSAAPQSGAGNASSLIDPPVIHPSPVMPPPESEPFLGTPPPAYVPPAVPPPAFAQSSSSESSESSSSAEEIPAVLPPSHPDYVSDQSPAPSAWETARLLLRALLLSINCHSNQTGVNEAQLATSDAIKALQNGHDAGVARKLFAHIQAQPAPTNPISDPYKESATTIPVNPI